MLALERRRLILKLVRELVRVENVTIEHAPREARRIGDAPPTLALRAVAAHAVAMRARLEDMLEGHGLSRTRSGLGATLASLRSRVVDRVVAAEHAYRTALLQLRHAIDVVVLLRGVARTERLFGVIRWCDDWLAARRTLVSRVEAQLDWFARAEPPEARTPMTPPLTGEDDDPGEPSWFERP
jgi:hypothetical protein